MSSSNRKQEFLRFSFPIILSMVAMNIMGLVDSALAGLLGTKALAAYGLAFFLLFIHASPLMGLSTAVQALTARYVGRGEGAEVRRLIWAAVFISLLYGLIVPCLSPLYIDSLLTFMTKDPEVQELADRYLKVRFLGVFAIGITHSFRGYWNGLGRPRLYLLIMGSSYVLNALLSYALIMGSSGFTGLALGSTIATIFAAVINLIVMLKSEHIMTKQGVPGKLWKEILAQSFPSGLQQFLFALGLSVFFAIIGRIGVPSLAAANVLVTVSLFLIYPAMAMGMASATFVGRSIGKSNFTEARTWVKEGAIVSAIFFGVIGVLMLLIKREILTFFIHDPVVMVLADLPLALFLLTLSLEAIGQVYAFSFFGAGKPAVVLVLTISFQWLGILPLSYLLGSRLEVIWFIHIMIRCLQGLAFFYCWRRVRLAGE